MWSIIWADGASEQFNQTLEFWIENNQSYDYSRKLLSEVLNIEELLQINPYIGVKVIHPNTKTEFRRFVILKTYSLVYKIENDIIYIVAFWDNRMNTKNFKI